MIYLQSFLALAFVLGLIVLLYAALQRWGLGVGGRRNRSIQVVESVSLGDRRELFLIRVGGQSFLLAAAGREVSLLSTLEPDSETFEGQVPERSGPAALTPLRAGEGA